MRRTAQMVLAGVAMMGCSRSALAPSTDAAREERKAMPATESVTADAPAAGVLAAVANAAGAPAPASVPAPGEPARMIVRSAELTLQVHDVRKTLQQVTDATQSVRGFLGASRFWHEGDAERASVTLRVPAASLDSTLGRIRGMALRVENEVVSGEDVTRQAVDLNAQLVNLRATEVELRALLTTVRQNAKRAADVLEVHAELSRVRGEIEQHTAELQSLTQLAAMSTITLTLVPDVVATPIAGDGWRAGATLHNASRALVATFRAFADGAIWCVVYGAPVLAVLAAAGLALRALRRRFRGTAVVAQG